MTQTLTTERQQFEEYFNDFYGCHPTDHHDPIHVEGIWHAWQASNTRAANREAQPVGEIHTVAESRNPGVNIHMFNSEKIIPNGTKLYTAPPAPAVPEEMTGDGVLSMHDCGYIEGWNECRAAMLAQPVSSGYKLVPVEPTAEMISSAMGIPETAIAIYKRMLAAAPEGGNG